MEEFREIPGGWSGKLPMAVECATWSHARPPRTVSGAGLRFVALHLRALILVKVAFGPALCFRGRGEWQMGRAPRTVAVGDARWGGGSPPCHAPCFREVETAIGQAPQPTSGKAARPLSVPVSLHAASSPASRVARPATRSPVVELGEHEISLIDDGRATPSRPLWRHTRAA